MEVILNAPPNPSRVTIYSGFSSSAYTAANVGSGFGVFKQLLSGSFQFKSLIATSPLELTNNANDITISIDETALEQLIQDNVNIVLPTPSRVVVTNSLTGEIEVSPITTTKLGYLTDVTSNLQAQLTGKQAIVTGAITTVLSSDLTPSRVVVSNVSGKVEVSSITTSLLDYLSGLSGNIQTQLDDKIGTVTASPIQMSGGFRTQTSGDYIKFLTLNIGVWNMDVDDSKAVPHGLGDRTKIRSCEAVVFPDIGTTMYPLNNTSAAGVVEGAVIAWDDTNIYLYRVAGGAYDSSSFDSLPTNRGYVLITYIV